MPIYLEGAVPKVMHFGFGDIAVMQCDCDPSCGNILAFEDVNTHHEIGEGLGSGSLMDASVIMVFEKPESIDVVITELKAIKARMMQAEGATDANS